MGPNSWTYIAIDSKSSSILDKDSLMGVGFEYRKTLLGDTDMNMRCQLPSSPLSETECQDIVSIVKQSFIVSVYDVGYIVPPNQLNRKRESQRSLCLDPVVYMQRQLEELNESDAESNTNEKDCGVPVASSSGIRLELSTNDQLNRKLLCVAHLSIEQLKEHCLQLLPAPSSGRHKSHKITAASSPIQTLLRKLSRLKSIGYYTDKDEEIGN